MDSFLLSAPLRGISMTYFSGGKSGCSSFRSCTEVEEKLLSPLRAVRILKGISLSNPWIEINPFYRVQGY